LEKRALKKLLDIGKECVYICYEFSFLQQELREICVSPAPISIRAPAPFETEEAFSLKKASLLKTYYSY